MINDNDNYLVERWQYASRQLFDLTCIISTWQKPMIEISLGGLSESKKIYIRF